MTRVVVDRRGREERYSADVVVVSCGAVELGRAAAALGARPAPERPGELLRRRRPQLHGPHQLGRDRDLPDAEHDEVPEDARRQRLLLGRGRLGAAARAHPDARQVRPQHPPRRARRGSRPASRSTTWPSTRSTSGSRPRTCPTPTTASPSTARATSTWPRPTQRGGAPAAAAQAQGPARRAGLPGGADPELVGARPAHPARRRSRTSAAPCASATDPRDVGARRQLQGARPRQPLRRRHELLPVVERREPGADGDGERAARRRPPARAPRRVVRRRPCDEPARRWPHDRATRSPSASARACSPASPARPR